MEIMVQHSFDVRRLGDPSKKPQPMKGCGLVARPAGVEPTAYRLGGGRSILLSYGRIT